MTRHESLLEGIRVLDLTDEKGLLCGKVLGDFGADVIKIEKPGGDPARNIGPFYKDIPDPEKSLFWFATNTSKRGITLNIESADGQELFKRLAEKADIVVESFEPGYMDCLGLGYADLKAIKPDIIFTSITPFGQTGPYAHYQATDLIGAAMGGMARILGDLGRPPVRMGADPQSYFHAGLQGALGSMMAYYHREMTGVGQHVDVSMQDAVELTLMNAVEIFDILKANLVGLGQFFVSVRPQGRHAVHPHRGPLQGRLCHPHVRRRRLCRIIAVIAGAGGMGQHRGIRPGDEGLRFPHHVGCGHHNPAGERRAQLLCRQVPDDQDQGRAVRGGGQEGHPHGALRLLRGCPPERPARGPGLLGDGGAPGAGGGHQVPWSPAQDEGDPWKIQRRAPLIGEHNEEIYEHELGLSGEQLAVLKANGVI